MSISKKYIPLLCNCIYNNAKQSNFKGYDPYDIKENKLYKILPGRIIIDLLEHYSPLLTRKVLNIQQKQYSNAISLFLLGKTIVPNKKDLKEIKHLYHLLMSLKSNKSKYLAWGYPFEWKSMKLFPKFTPNLHSTFLATYSLFEARKYISIPKKTFYDIKQFYLNELNIWEDESKSMIVFSYTPLDNSRVINVNATTAYIFTRFYEYFKSEEDKEVAKKILSFIFAKQLKNGLWYYSDDSKVIDNYHTAWTILFVNRTAQKIGLYNRYHKQINHAYESYKKHFISENALPKFSYNEISHVDIMSYAAAIWLFTEFRDYEMATKVLNWTLKNMLFNECNFYHRIYYPKHWRGGIYNIYNTILSLHKKRVSFIRWGQAWMYFVLSNYLKIFIKNI